MISDQYLAGLIDGEGSLTIVHRPRRDPGRKHETVSYAQVAITLCDRAPLDAIAERFGSSTVFALKQVNPKYRPAFRWQAHGPQAEALVRAVQPYLLIKQEQARIFLLFRETLLHRGQVTEMQAAMNDEVKAWRMELRAKMRILNQRGARDDRQMPLS